MNILNIVYTVLCENYTFVNSGCKWPSKGSAPAAKTRGGAFDGPGPINNFLGKSKGLSNEVGGGSMIYAKYLSVTTSTL